MNRLYIEVQSGGEAFSFSIADLSTEESELFLMNLVADSRTKKVVTFVDNENKYIMLNTAQCPVIRAWIEEE